MVAECCEMIDGFSVCLDIIFQTDDSTAESTYWDSLANTCLSAMMLMMAKWCKIGLGMHMSWMCVLVPLQSLTLLLTSKFRTSSLAALAGHCNSDQWQIEQKIAFKPIAKLWLNWQGCKIYSNSVGVGEGELKTNWYWLLVAQASLYSERSLGCNHCPWTSVICDAQQCRHRLACPFLDIVLPWFIQSSCATTIIHCSL